jgi:hypothetical protein
MSTPELSDEKLDLTRVENERYLRRDPEVKNKMISEFMVGLLKDEPKGVLPYAVVFFTSSHVESDSRFPQLCAINLDSSKCLRIASSFVQFDAASLLS